MLNECLLNDVDGVLSTGALDQQLALVCQLEVS